MQIVKTVRPVTVEAKMAELINLRVARKRNARQRDGVRAQANRLAYGQSRQQQRRETAELTKAERNLDRHRIDRGDIR
jgi:Domain of unknown function (DUF4169)